LKFILLKKFRE